MKGIDKNNAYPLMVDELIHYFKHGTPEESAAARDELKRRYKAYVQRENAKESMYDKSPFYEKDWLRRFAMKHPDALSDYHDRDKVVDAFIRSGDESLYEFLYDTVKGYSEFHYPCDVLIGIFEQTHSKYIALLLIEALGFDFKGYADYLVEHFADFDIVYFDACNFLIENERMTLDQVDRTKLSPYEYAWLVYLSGFAYPRHHDPKDLIEQYHHGSANDSKEAAYELMCRYATDDIEVQDLLAPELLLNDNRDLGWCGLFFLKDRKKHLDSIQQSFEHYHDDFLFEDIISYSSQEYLEAHRDELKPFAENIDYYLECRRKIIEDKSMIDNVTPACLDNRCFDNLWFLSRYTTEELLDMARTNLDKKRDIIRDAIAERLEKYHGVAYNSFNEEDTLNLIKKILSSDDMAIRSIMSGLFVLFGENSNWDEDFQPILLSAWKRYHDPFLADLVSSIDPLAAAEDLPW